MPRLADDPRIPPETHDLAKMHALQHLLTTLWTFVAANRADALGLPAERVASELRDGVKGTMVEGQVPADFLALMRDHAMVSMDRVVDQCRLMDRLKAANPDWKGWQPEGPDGGENG